ncbi:SufD family Fe-S cluster assembly protein [Sandaracinobacter neustonicus]|uniref:SufD family Fe-S cluster assembly protein n=1 Tax=Sandaracinobacter neustonicus TaxID=1715348 RepID=A0A501XHH9_9SPHN|nr:SufD family Fe-S cluster assembly protein [Sandaracinobacter neustonicus]TPE60091.1 SufD family Fe-S cluster assembly protein [Sandaracinobacter neustonicus]
MTALPTRKSEEWRYADLKAVEALWPPPPARLISIPAGQVREEVVRVTDGGIHDLRVELAPGARLALVILVQSGSYARVAVQARLKAGAHLDLGGILLGAGDATQEIVTDVRHDEPGADSRQRIRLVLDERATGNYLGRIAVARDAQQTDAEQSARALVLKRTATANLRPELEIFADDVKCAHGCTVGELDKAALFYLESRGIPRAEAQALLTRAFVADALSGLANSEALEVETGAWLGARA